MLITLARKPMTGSVAANVLAHGCGALNVDGCRIDAGERPLILSTASRPSLNTFGESLNGSMSAGTTMQGRWPANLLITPTAADTMDAQSGTTQGVVRKPTGKPIYPTEGAAMVWNQNSVADKTERGFADTGGASRYFKQIG